MNYSEARTYLNEINQYGSVLGLESIQRLLNKLGNPQDKLKAVHIAGTNGKGSTMAFLQSILLEAGYNVGRYSSPAVFEYREIITYNTKPIEREILAEIISFIKEKCDEMVEEGFSHPTPFEIETAMAFEYFKRKACDIILIECGLGGATDATNVMSHVLCSIISSISLDHMKVLGDTIEKIATIKAGIIKDECPVVMSKQTKEAEKVINKSAKEKHSQLTITGRAENINIKNFMTEFDYMASEGKNYHVCLKKLGTYQILNSVTAIEAATVLEKQGFVLEKYIEKGLLNAVWNGRLEVLSAEPLVVIDGAHNPGAVKELKQSIDLYFTNKRITFIMGVLADKDFDSEAEMIAKCAEKIITVTPDNPRALSAEKLADTVKKFNPNVCAAESVYNAVSMAYNTLKENEADMILAFGSLSYLGDLKENGYESKQLKPKGEIDMFDQAKIEEAIKLLLEGIGEDAEREGIKDTPKRVARMYQELLVGMNQTPEEHLSRTFTCKNEEVVIEKDITFYSTCEHHLMPFYGKAHIAYIPNGKVVGISKLARTVEVYARRLQIQEQMTHQIAEAIHECLNAKGVLVMVEAEHMCMSARGIKKPGSKTVTFSSTGQFKEDGQLRSNTITMMKN